tara:strand:- start:26 stop:220 length:195 start_codon:yes stop_codon:yes gene_type:complete
MAELGFCENSVRYTILDLSNKKCFRCGNYVYHEKPFVLTLDTYPYYCAKCDENMDYSEVKEELK